MQRTTPEMRSAARALRNEPTPTERRLWQVLHDHRPRFTRQLVVSHYIIDVACRSLKIAIELDGGHHGEQIGADDERTSYLEAQGWTVLRFWNNDVLNNLAGIYRTITDAVRQASTHPRPLPFREGS